MKLLIEDENDTARREMLDILCRCAVAAGRVEGIADKCFVSLRFVDDDEIRVLNCKYRGIDRATDVLSFPTIQYPAGKTAGSDHELLLEAYDDSLKGFFLGNIIISTEHAESQAEEYGHSTIREYAYLLTHGLFHLMGYDHMTEKDKTKMRFKEEKALSTAGIWRETSNG